jgi:hypothetical protein
MERLRGSGWALQTGWQDRQLGRNGGTNKQVNYFICEWKTAFRAARTGYDWPMVRAPREADLVRLRQFLKRLEADAQAARGNGDVRHEIEKLKDEIAYLEGVRSRAFLFQIGIDYGAPRAERRGI